MATPCTFQDVHSDELQQLRDRLAESDRSLRILRQREARAQERCANIQQERDDIQAKMDSTQVRIREQPRQDGSAENLVLVNILSFFVRIMDFFARDGT